MRSHQFSLLGRYLFDGKSLALMAFILCASVFLANQTSASDSAAVLTSTDELQAGGEFDNRSALPGAALYSTHCATCHLGQVYKAPHQTWLEMMSQKALYTTMTEGIMAPQASKLSEQQKVEVIEYLTSQRYTPAKSASQPVNICTGDAATFAAWDNQEITGWGRDTSRYVPDAVAGLNQADLPKLRLKWSFGYAGAFRARSQPSIAMGAIYTGSQDGTVYALDLETGCVRWSFSASAEVRTGIVLGQHGETRPLAFFGDIIANLYAVDATTGELVWKISADDHPSATLTGTPAYHAGIVYAPVSSLEVTAAADPDYPCCTFRGKVIAVDANSGSTTWESYTVPEPPSQQGVSSVGTAILAPSGAPVWNSPTLDPANNRLFFGSGENYSSPADGNSDAIFAVRMDTGERLWTRQVFAGDAWNVGCMMSVNHPNCPPEMGPDYDQGSSPLLIKRPEAEDVIVAGHKDGSVVAYDAATGAQRQWVTKVGRGSIQGGVHFGMAAEGTRVYAPINDMNDTRNGEDLDPALARPGVHAIDAENGAVLWSHVQEDICSDDRPLCDPGVSAPLTALTNAVIAGHLDGHLRAYDGQTGEVIWDYDTKRDFNTVNGVAASGGGMSGAGVTVAQGHVVVNSGYGLYFHEPGNALLVFAVDESPTLTANQ